MNESIFKYPHKSMPKRRTVRKLTDGRRSIWSCVLLVTYFKNFFKSGKDKTHCVIVAGEPMCSFEQIVKAEAKLWRKILCVHALAAITTIFGIVALLIPLWHPFDWSFAKQSLCGFVGAVFIVCSIMVRKPVKIWRLLQQRLFDQLQSACYELDLLRYCTYYYDEKTWSEFSDFQRVETLQDPEVRPTIHFHLSQLKKALFALTASGDQHLDKCNFYGKLFHHLCKVHVMFLGDGDDIHPSVIEKSQHEALDGLYDWLITCGKSCNWEHNKRGSEVTSRESDNWQ